MSGPDWSKAMWEDGFYYCFLKKGRMSAMCKFRKQRQVAIYKNISGICGMAEAVVVTPTGLVFRNHR